MQLRPRNKLVSIPESNIYRDVRKQGDRPRHWSWRGKGKPAPCVVVKFKKEKA